MTLKKIKIKKIIECNGFFEKIKKIDEIKLKIEKK
jgi:hypothetical protein